MLSIINIKFKAIQQWHLLLLQLKWMKMQTYASANAVEKKKKKAGCDPLSSPSRREKSGHLLHLCCCTNSDYVLNQPPLKHNYEVSSSTLQHSSTASSPLHQNQSIPSNSACFQRNCSILVCKFQKS